MSLLLDTHVWIWSQEDPERLGPRTRERLVDPAEALFVSTVSTLEIARLLDSGVLELQGALKTWVSRSLDLLGGRTVELTHEIAADAYRLPAGFHRDPADRILVATARARDLTLVTADRRILACRHVRRHDARL